jgi:hypothetical protein
MKTMMIVFFAILSFQASSLTINNYNGVLEQFKNANPEVSIERLENQAMYGRCFMSTDLETATPAALVVKKMEATDKVLSIGLLWNEMYAADYYDNMSFAELEERAEFFTLEQFPGKTLIRYSEKDRSYLRQDADHIYEMYVNEYENYDTVCYYSKKE